MTVEVPAALHESLATVDPAAGAWLDRLPALAAEFLDRWQLRRDGPAMHGVCALVLPVRMADDAPAVLKLTWPHDDAREEHAALDVWDGDGAVRLLGSDPDAWVLLLERLHAGHDLSAVPLDQALATVGELLRRLNARTAGPFVGVDERARAWATELAAARRQAPAGVPERIVDRAAGVLGDLLATTRPVLLHTDLHYENVLAADREPWLAIDPKPLLGDAAYEIAPLLWNRWLEATAPGDLVGHLRRRADVVAEAAGLDQERVAAWVVVREAVEALDATQTSDTEWRDMSVSIADAFVSRLP